MPAPRAVSRTVCGDANHATLPKVKSHKVLFSRAIDTEYEHQETIGQIVQDADGWRMG